MSRDLREILSRQASEVAPDLLGWRLSHTTDEGTVTVALTEVEAYHGADDPASHAFRGPTPRNRVMFGLAGHLYVYRSYGIHWCANVVTGEGGTASAVLLRAGRVTEGNDVVRRRRGERTAECCWARGPGCLGQALGLTGGHSGVDLLGDGALVLRPGARTLPGTRATGPRVGVSRAADVPWRFWLAGEPSVSAYRRAPTAST
ncbi:putative 3-methyladenine DNA glycosylase [Nocardioides psychrotolerans]|uniref:Putative 3-methyladenine DNA glycosylase n=1 Tax=Nocardioides psychrotolerans TaxID=1005945 RepID=A0A1I3KVI9_9ACTN|nr:DNA-3-methyladenine glycosylase [Nocardioides psychrotolerans]GEP38582.1 putative 3-methyladenine DNA glycosylase [Nocardioides psychrotolerans]SFI76414.1 DNA-3-methyladenine glycosylase [Nocardioides psychrotolerans]